MKMETPAKGQLKRKKNWQLQEAKAMFSEVIRATAVSPQIITIHGKKTAVILSFAEYEKLSGPRLSLFQFIQNSPLRDIKLELPQRLPEETREAFL